MAAATDKRWVETYDPRTDSFYYFDHASNETIWEKPEHYVMAADDEMMSAVVSMSLSFDSILSVRVTS